MITMTTMITMKRNLFLITLPLLFLTTFLFAQSPQDVEVADSTLTVSVNSFIDDWHSQASEADIAYFEKISEDGIYIGTDATELWTKDEFYVWAKKYFDRGEAWSFTTIERNVYFSDDRQYAWFDELLNTAMGVCRASGVLKKNGNSWKIEHYHLSIAIPNEDLEDVKKVIEKK